MGRGRSKKSGGTSGREDTNIGRGSSNVVEPFAGSAIKTTVFHGTNADFTDFDKKKIGENFALSEGGFFFTSSEKQASRYGNNVKEVYLNMQNPYVVESPALISPTDFYDAHDLGGEAMANNNDGVIVVGTGDYAGKSIYVVFEPKQIRTVRTKKARK